MQANNAMIIIFIFHVGLQLFFFFDDTVGKASRDMSIVVNKPYIYIYIYIYMPADFAVQYLVYPRSTLGV